MPMWARAATDVHTFWPVSDHPPSTRVARVDERGQIGPGPRFAEQLAPDDLAAQGGGHPALGLLRRPVGDDGREGPGRYGQVRPADAGVGQGLVDDQLLDGTGVPPPRRRPVRNQQSVVTEGPTLGGGVVQGGHGRRHRGHLPPERLGFGREVDGDGPSMSLDGQTGRLRPQGRRAPGQLAQRGGPPEMDMHVVLPGEPHPTEHLDSALGRLDVAVEGQAGGQGYGQSTLAAQVGPGVGDGLGVDSQSRVPGGGHPLFDPGQHVGQPVLDPLELADGPPELLAGTRMFGRAVEAPPGPSGRFGRRHQKGRLSDPFRRGLAEHPFGGHQRVLEGPPGATAGRVETGQGVDGHRGVPLDHNPLDRILDGHRRQHQGHRRPADNRADRPADPQRPFAVQRSAQAGALEGRPVGRSRRHHQRSRGGPIGQTGHHLFDLGRAPASGHHRADHGSGGPRPGRRRSSQLLGHHRQLQHPGALSSVLLGKMDAEETLGAQIGPERREAVGLGVEGGPGHGGGTEGLDPAPQRHPQLLVFVLQADGHRQAPVGSARGWVGDTTTTP